MSEQAGRRMRIVAVGAALVALVFTFSRTLIAGIRSMNGVESVLVM
jgi:hypothetical protein